MAALCRLVVDPRESWRFLPFIETAVLERERLFVGTVSVCGWDKSGKRLVFRVVGMVNNGMRGMIISHCANVTRSASNYIPICLYVKDVFEGPMFYCYII